MSDSDSELLTTNRVFSFQNESTTVSARGPNINTSNLTGISFRNNVLTSTLNMPKNYEWQRRAESNYDQRSVGYRRETSPMSVTSACDARQRNFHSSFYTREMSSHRSVYNGRSGSPMSMRSIDSNATMCASDIVMAFKNTQFNKYDLRMIKEAYNKLIKHKARKRVEKRRNLKLFLKGYRRKSGYDSGELGSNSSMSSDDNRSTRTLNYKSNMSSCRSTKTDVADFRRTIKESDLFKDCSDNFRQNRMHGMLGRPVNMNASRSSVSSFRSIIEKPTKSLNPPVNFNKTQGQSTLQDRFKNGFLLPSQRFNKSVAASSIPEVTEKSHQQHKQQNGTRYREHESPSRPQKQESEDEEIFSKVTTIERSGVNQRKRSIDSDDEISLPIQKRPKVASPCKNMSQSFKSSTVLENAKNDFNFAKPAFPVRKSANQKTKEKMLLQSTIMNTEEKLISKSRAPLSDSIIHPLHINLISQPIEVAEKEDNTEQYSSQNTTDLSMRPSFIKRKLFTQNMDVTEKTNDIAANSPQNSIYGAIQKEKNKARKLVTSQYCLSRDIQADESNLLDLIHKIVPAERMNATNQTNKTAVNNKSEDNDDKWDVTSIISTRNNDEDLSDTYTDEDTMIANDGKLQPSPKATGKLAKKSPPKQTEKKMDKSPVKAAKVIHKVLVEKNGTSKTTVQKCVKSFWDTDFESDAEAAPPTWKEQLKENKTENITQNVASKVKFLGFSSMFPANKTLIANKTSITNNALIMNSTIDSVQRLNNTSKSLKICSHRNNKPNIKKTVQESFKEHSKSVIEPQSKKQKPAKVNSCLDLSKQENIELNNKENKQKSKPESKKTPPKLPKTKNITKKTKENEPPKRQNSKQDKTKNNDIAKSQNKKIETDQSKIENKKEADNVQINKKSGTTQNKKEVECNENKPANNKKSETNKKQTNKPQNKKSKEQKADSVKLDTTLKNNKKITENARNEKNTNVSKLSDSIIYEDSFETNNNKSMRPVRSCRISKLNETHDTSKALITSRSLRSREVSLTEINVVDKSKPIAKRSKKTNKNEQSVLSDLSFSLTKAKNSKKSISSSNSRLLKPKEIDSSDVSFSLNDKDSPRSKRNQGDSAKSKKYKNFVKEVVIKLTNFSMNSMNTNNLNEKRPTRHKVANRRYIT